MFEKVVLARSSNGPAITAGELAEALLFYQNVHLVLDYSSLFNLSKSIGMPNLLALLSRKNVTAVYSDQTICTRSDTVNGQTYYSFGAFSLAGTGDGKDINTCKKRIQNILERQQYDKKKAKRYTERFRQLVPTRNLTSDYYVEGGILKAAQTDLGDNDFLRQSICLIISRLLREEIDHSKLLLEVIPGEPGFQISTNLDLSRLNHQVSLINPNHGDVKLAHLINDFLTAKSDSVLAAHYGGEFYTSEICSSIIDVKHNSLLRRIGIEKRELQEFSSNVIGDLPNLREVINSEARTFNDFLKLLEKSDKFRDWATGLNPDEKLVKEYWESVTSVGWINKAPSKGIRYVIGNLLGAVEPISGMLASAADSFLIEKILGGWRPNHFVERSLKPFLDDDSN